MFQRLLIVDGSSILNESYYGTLPEQMKREKIDQSGPHGMVKCFIIRKVSLQMLYLQQ